jgi:hypothetical protein
MALETGALPSPVTFKNNGNGTATLSAEPRMTLRLQASVASTP